MSPKKYVYKNKPTTFQYIVFKTTANILTMFGVIFILLAFGPVLRSEVWYQLKVFKDQEYSLFAKEDSVADSVFSRYLSSNPVLLDPVNREFALVIEKIGVNAPVVTDVSVTSEEAYKEALKSGVAHASVSEYPSQEPGNVYIFAHASTDFWDLGKYATVFNLLRKLDVGDKIHLFYEGSDYVYEVVNKEKLQGWNTYPITRPVIEPTLTLQTCDPPGTTLNRLVVTAVLKEVIEL